MSKHIIKRGDTARKFNDTLTADGEPLDLTGATVYFVLKNKCSDAVRKSLATVVDAEEGTVEYQPVALDVGTVGEFVAEWEVNYTGGSTQTVPEEDYIEIQVKSDLG